MSSIAISALERGQRRRPQRETLALLVGALALDGDQRAQFEAAARSAQAYRSGASVLWGPWIASTTASLPRALTSFVGREAQLSEIVALLRDHRMVTLTGAGGIGKTQTALRAAPASSDAICFVGLAPIDDPSLVTTAIASAFGVQEVPNHRLLHTLLAYLKNKALLLILDNCEHVIAQAAVVAETLLSRCPELRILATSREPLRAAGERNYRLPSLSIPSSADSGQPDATTARAYESVILFVDRARAANYDFALTDENAPIVAEICKHLDGIPLAIELAAAHVRSLSVRTIAKSLDDGLNVLTGGERTARPRQQTMRAAIDWSYNLLSVQERRVFERLSAFASGCTLAVAVAVCGGDDIVEDRLLDVLSSLVDKSIVVADLEENEPRYQLLGPFQQYAREKLAMSFERDIVMRRFAIAYFELARPLEDGVYFEQEALDLLARDELDNWRAVLQWTLTEGGDTLLGQRLVGRLAVLWHHVAPVEGQRWLASARSRVVERTPTSVVARLDYTEATIAMALDQLEVQLASSRRAVARYRILGDPFWLGLALVREAQALFYLGRISEVARVLREALPLARELRDDWLTGCMLLLASSVNTSEGNLGGARGYLAEALRCFDSVESKRDLAWTLNNLSLVEIKAGNFELALQHTADALEFFRKSNHAWGVTITLRIRVPHLILSGRYGEADASAREELNLARERGLDVTVAYALQHLATIPVFRSRDLSDPDLSAYVHAARILGYVDGRLTAMGSPRTDEEQDYVQVLTRLRDVLGAEAVAQYMAEGTSMTEERAIEETLNF